MKHIERLSGKSEQDAVNIAASVIKDLEDEFFQKVYSERNLYLSR